MRILFLFYFLFLFLYANKFAIAVESRYMILTMHESSGSFIPKAPEVPKVDNKVFESTGVSHLNKSGRVNNNNLKKNSSTSGSELALPDAWSFSAGFKIKSDLNLISYFKELKKLKIPVFKLYCKHEKSPVRLNIGPYFDSDPKKVMARILKKTDDAALKKWLRKNMVVDSFDPESCEFIS